jgi:hypothetical protein
MVTLAWLLPSIRDDILITPQSSTTAMNIDTPICRARRSAAKRRGQAAAVRQCLPAGHGTLADVTGGRFGHVATSIVRDNRRTQTGHR